MIVFIAGVHGVGKSTFCDRFIQEVSPQTDITNSTPLYTSASDLIKRGKRNFAKENEKVVSNAADNQKILINELSALKKESKRILLDGHFCLLGDALNIIELPESTFRDLEFDHILLVEPVSIDELQARYLKRENTKLANMENLKEFIAKERECAQGVAQSLGIPLTRINNNAYDVFSATLKQLFCI